MKKTTFLKCFCLITTLFLLIALTAVPALAANPKYDAKDIPLSLSFALGNNTVNYYLSPYQGALTVTNNTAETLEGTIELHFVNNYYSGEEEYVRLDLPLEIAAGVTKTTSFVVDFSSNANQCRVDLVNKSGKLLRTQTIPLNFSGYSFVYGWMSPSGNEEDLLNRSSNNSYYCASLTPDNFPLDFELMKQYNFIIVNDADLSASSPYSEKQLHLLQKYIAEGGTVIVGTGKDTDILQAFSSYFSGSVDKAITRTTSSFTQKLNPIYFGNYQSHLYINNVNYYASGYADDVIIAEAEYGYDSTEEEDDGLYSLAFRNLSLCRLTDDNLIATSSGVSGEIAFYRVKGTNLYFSNFNFNAPELTNNASSNTFLLSLFYSAGIPLYDSLTDVTMLPEGDRLEAYGPSGISPVVPILLLILYSGLGLILPFVLAKAKKKPRIAQIGIPSSAVLFAIFVILFGTLRNGFSDYAYTVSVAELESDGEATVQAAVMTAGPRSGKKTIHFNEDNTVYYTGDSHRMYNYVYSKYTGCQIDGSAKGGVTIPSVSSWESAYISGYFRDKYNGNIATEIQFDPNNSTFSVTLRNLTGKDLREAVVYVLGNTLLIGDFPAGDERTFSSLRTQIYNSFDVDLYLENAFYIPHGLTSDDMEEDLYGTVRANYSYYSHYPYYSTYSSNSLSRLADVSKEDALATETIAQFISNQKFNAYTADRIHFFAVDTDGTMVPNVNGKTVKKTTGIRIVHQCTSIPEDAQNELGEEAFTEDVQLSLESDCDISHWENGYLTLDYHDVAVFYTPAPWSLDTGKTICVQLESKDELTDCLLSATIVSRADSFTTLPSVIAKADINNQYLLSSNELIRYSIKAQDYDKYSSAYDYYRYSPLYVDIDTYNRTVSFTLPENNRNYLVLVFCNDGTVPKTITGVSVSMAGTDSQTPEN